MFQVRYDLGNRHEYSQVFNSEWAANYVAIQVVHANLGVIQADVINRKTGEILKSYAQA